MRNVKRVLYRRQLILFLALSLVLVGVLSMLVFGSFRSFSERQLEQTLTDSLRRVDHQVRFVLERALYVALALYRSPVTQAVLYRSDADELDRLAALEDLRERIAAYPFLYSAALYNRTTGIVGTSPREEAPDSPQQVQDLLARGGRDNGIYLVRRLASVTAGYPDEEVITLVYTEDPSPAGYRHAVLIDIPFRSILEHVASATDAGDTRVFFTVAEPSVTFPPLHEELAARIRGLMAEGTPTGTMTVDTPDGQALVGFVRTRAADATAVMLYPLTELRAAAYALQRRIATIGLFVLAAGWALSVGLTRYAYLPVQQLLDRVDPEHFYANVRSRLNEMEYLSTHFGEVARKAARLEDESMQRSSVLGELRLRALLLGEPVPDSLAPSPAEQTTYYCLLVYLRSGHVHEYEHEHIRQTVREIAPDDSTVVFVTRGESVVLVPHRVEDSLGPSPVDLGSRLMYALNRNTEAFGLAMLEAPVDAHDLLSGHERLMALRRHELFHGEPRLLTPAFVRSAHGRRADYPASLEKDLLEAMRFGHRRRYVDGVSEFCVRSRDCTYESTVSALLQLALVLVRSVDEVGGRTQEREGHFASDVARTAERWSSFDDVVRWFTDIYDRFQAATAGAGDARADEGRERTEQAIGFIRENLADPQLSVPTIAEAVGISRSYFSRTFKKHAGVSANEFITRERIVHAQRLLVGTRDTVESISIACGIHNTKYFFQLFRKQVGVTPAAYRAAHRGDIVRTE
ncbi:MAG: helix-turn-helix domain-containing protein [Spirochaetota bacterium]